MAEIGGKVTPRLGRKGARTGTGSIEGAAAALGADLGLNGGKAENWDLVCCCC